MFSKCANPECENSCQDYRGGRLFRFHKSHPEGRSPVNDHSVQHFWLCSSCYDTYTLQYSDDRALLKVRGDWSPTEGVPT
jgi:hypothetical protein